MSLKPPGTHPPGKDPHGKGPVSKRDGSKPASAEKAVAGKAAHKHDHAALSGGAWLERVEAMCAQKGLQLTPLRREIADLLAKAGKPVGAYEMMDQLGKAKGRGVAPPTVYRTLDFLVENGFVVKIESRQTYMICDDPGHDHHGILLICSECGQSAEVDDPAVDKVLVAAAQAAGFHLQRQMVEVEGLCKPCREAAGGVKQ